MEGNGIRADGIRRLPLREWLFAKAAILSLILGTAWVGGVAENVRTTDLPAWLRGRVADWDSDLYAAIAIRGYPTEPEPLSYYSFLPGFPWMMRNLGQLLNIEVRWAGLLMVTAASLACVYLLHRLIFEQTDSGRAAYAGTLAFLVCPAALFWSVVYTEAPFLALALGAWLAGRRQAWWMAGVLAGLASTLRITGPLLAAALLVMYFTTRSQRSRPVTPGLLALSIGPGVMLAYTFWLHSRTGHWDTWTRAQMEGFGRATAWPWVGLRHSLELISGTSAERAAVAVVEILSAACSWIVTGALARRRWWPEATFAGLCAFAMSFSTTYMSSPRLLSSIFPMYVLLGVALSGLSAPVRRLYWSASLTLCSAASVGWALQWWIA